MALVLPECQAAASGAAARDVLEWHEGSLDGTPRVHERNSKPQPPKVMHLDQLDRIVGPHTLTWLPIRPTLGIRAFGTNAYIANETGDDVVEAHDELAEPGGRPGRSYRCQARFRVIPKPGLPQRIVGIDEAPGVSGSGVVERSGFARLAAGVGLGHAGLVLGLEVSRLARNNAAWYRLLDLCGVTDTVIGDGDGLYHPGSFNGRLLLGLKGTMSEAERHVLPAHVLLVGSVTRPLAASCGADNRSGWLGVLTNPAYARVYVYGRKRTERYVDEHVAPRKRVRRLKRADREVLIEDHHPGFIDWRAFESNQQRIAGNVASVRTRRVALFARAPRCCKGSRSPDAAVGR